MLVINDDCNKIIKCINTLFNEVIRKDYILQISQFVGKL